MFSVAVMQSAAALERVAYEFAVDNYEEGVHYFECRFAPQLHANTLDGTAEGLDIENVSAQAPASAGSCPIRFDTGQSVNFPPSFLRRVICAAVILPILHWPRGTLRTHTPLSPFCPSAHRSLAESAARRPPSPAFPSRCFSR
jgi:hypothetical protein